MSLIYLDTMVVISVESNTESTCSALNPAVDVPKPSKWRFTAEIKSKMKVSTPRLGVLIGYE